MTGGAPKPPVAKQSDETPLRLRLSGPEAVLCAEPKRKLHFRGLQEVT